MGSETVERGCGAGFDAETRRDGAKTEKNEIVWSPCVSQHLSASAPDSQAGQSGFWREEQRYAPRVFPRLSDSA